MEISAISSIEFLKEAPVVTFDAGDRELISPEAMLNVEGADASAPAEEIATGNPAPDFTLSKMDGSGDVTLSSLKGQVVVLDFWATWCPPCRKGLPFLNEFDTWAKNEGWKVNVFAVNVWERGDKDAVDTIVKKFWAEKKFTTAVLMGSSDSKLTSNYGVSGIPTTVIIGPDGSISSQHSGFLGGEAMLKDLKESVAKALGKDVDSAKPEHPDHPN
jgi:thiol-disulfide isomerase/thioredoxin